MEILNYTNLLKVIDNIEIREEKEDIERTLDMEKEYELLELKLKKSGLLDDWYGLKQVCRKVNVRLLPYGSNLTSSMFKFADIGSYECCMSSGSHWSDYYGFTYTPENGITWKVWHTTNTHLWGGFGESREEQRSKYRYRIAAIEKFMDSYEKYREFQLPKIEEALKDRVKPEDIIK